MKPPSHRDTDVLNSLWLGASVALWVVLVGIGDAHDPISTKVTWTREIGPLVHRRCVSCHTRGGFSFPLTSYEEARPWAVAIKEETLAGEMPPWGAASGIGHFANDRQLTRHEIELIAAWVDGGAPRELPPTNPGFRIADPNAEGAPAATPNVDAPTDRTPARAPDRPPGTRVPLATAVIESATERTASVTLQVPAGMSLTAWSFDPGAPALVSRVELELASRWLGTWTPGDEPILFPPDAGLALGPSALFTARISYREPAARTIDQSGILIWTTREPRARTVRETTVVRSWRTTSAVEVFALRPAGAAATEVLARFADGAMEPLGAFAAEDTILHPTYRLTRPLTLPAGARVETTASVRLLYTDAATRTVKPNVRRRPRR